MAEIHFGTDGWRGRIAADYTFDNVRRAAQGFANHLRDEDRGGTPVVVGYDQRFAAEHFGAAAAEVMAANGFQVWLTESATPTPVISYSIVERGACAGINITASHNPPWDCGFKVRDENGAAVAPEGLRALEAVIPTLEEVQRMDLKDAEEQGLVKIWDPGTAYVEHISALVDIEGIKEAGLNILVEPMWGNGIGWFPRLLGGGATTVTEIHNFRHPLFPDMVRPEPIPPNIDKALEKSIDLGVDVCLIMDGDADRMGIGDENGHFINQLQVYGLLAYYLLEIRGQRRPMVKTISTTSMLEKLGAAYDVPVYRTGVGFKYVGPKMIETGAMIGGEESGGFAFGDSIPERDGILGNLRFLDLMVQTGKSPSALLEHLYDELGTSYYYDRIDTRFPSEKRPETRQRLERARPQILAGLEVTDIVTVDGYKYELGDGGWLLVRFSGTEPIIRVYCETTDSEKVQLLLDEGLRLAGLK